MRRTHQEIRKLRKEVRTARMEIARMAAAMEREKRMDSLISEMKRSAREMLLLSREL